MRRVLGIAVVALLTVGVFVARDVRAQEPQDIVDTAVAAGDFTTLVAAVEAAGLVDTLKGPGPFTVFAPTDAAFAALPAGTVESLLEPANRDTLTKILTFHVVPHEFESADLAGLAGRLETVAGLPLGFDATGTPVNIGGATLVAADIAASNGVIHVVDRVILPPR